MSDEQAHKLILVQQYDSGAEEWYCPTCGRRFMMQWSPCYQRVVLEAGDEMAVHNTGRGAMVVHRAQDEDPYLAPWIEWVKTADFESHWEE